MAKSLSEMSNEELWELFPIIIEKHNPIWKENYSIEKSIIEKTIGVDNIVRMNHFGSTCIPNLFAKPTIDILLEIAKDTDTEKLISDMQSINYVYTPQPTNPPPHIMLMKGYTPNGFIGQTYHVHIRYAGDWDELHFRDYLLAHPEIAEEYGKLKVELQKKYTCDRNGYTDAKSDFIYRITSLAKENNQK
ncbi:MAG: GrpB family protein [Bacillota bacterium]|nr:GrpB family protein [Bacillota bacterium]